MSLCIFVRVAGQHPEKSDPSNNLPNANPGYDWGGGGAHSGWDTNAQIHPHSCTVVGYRAIQTFQLAYQRMFKLWKEIGEPGGNLHNYRRTSYGQKWSVRHRCMCNRKPGETCETHMRRHDFHTLGKMMLSPGSAYIIADGLFNYNLFYCVIIFIL